MADESLVSDSHFDRFLQTARDQPDYAGLWVQTRVLPTTPPRHANDVTVVGFTGEIERHERELRALWGGPLCVVQQQHRYRDLHAVADALASHIETAHGFVVDSVGVDEYANNVRVQVALADERNQAWVDRRFGAGVVQLEGWLHPVQRTAAT